MANPLDADGSDRLNLVNPAGGLQAVELEWQDGALTLLGFNRRVTDRSLTATRRPCGQRQPA
jgi:hypothetical protein